MRLFCCILSGLWLFPVFLNASEPLFDYIFFDNSLMEGRYYYSQAVYQSPSWIKNAQQKLLVNEKEFYSPGNSLELQYVSAENGDWCAEVQYRPIRGNDYFKKPAILSFQLKTAECLSSSVLPKIGLRYKDKSLTNFVSLENYIPYVESGKWQNISIPLSDFGCGDVDNNRIKDLAAVVFRQSQSDNQTHLLYVDDIEFLPTRNGSFLPLKMPELKGIKAFERHIDLWWEAENIENIKYIRIYRSFDGHTFVPIGIQRPRINRFTDFIGEIDKKAFYRISAVDYALQETSLSPVLSAETRKMTDEAFLDMIEEAHFRYYWDCLLYTSRCV